MRIRGRWVAFDHGAVRPIVRAHISGESDHLYRDDFLIDTGADRVEVER